MTQRTMHRVLSGSVSTLCATTVDASSNCNSTKLASTGATNQVCGAEVSTPQLAMMLHCGELAEYVSVNDCSLEPLE